METKTLDACIKWAHDAAGLAEKQIENASAALAALVEENAELRKRCEEAERMRNMVEDVRFEQRGHADFCRCGLCLAVHKYERYEQLQTRKDGVR